VVELRAKKDPVVADGRGWASATTGYRDNGGESSPTIVADAGLTRADLPVRTRGRERFQVLIRTGER